MRILHEGKKDQSGFTLIEVLIALAIFAMLATSIFFVYGNILEIMSRTRTRTLASTLLNREIEMVRLLRYEDVGIAGGAPAGVLQQQRVETYEGVQFLIKAYVRNIDNSFDGTTGGSPNDTAPADYKLVEFEVSCALCYGIPPLVYTTWVAPQDLETASNNGSLFINAFDADGLPIYEADVEVVNNSTSPDITIIDQTNASGQLQLVDIPTSTNGYQITVSKAGYSSARTYTPGAAANSNPIQPHATVATQEITEMSFAIDRVSTLAVRTQDYLCRDIGSISMNLIGTKLIGSGPDVVKYSSSFTTNSTGDKTIHPIEWDTYHFTNTDTDYDIAGSIPLTPFAINPGTSSTIAFIMESKSSTSLLVGVVDATGTPLTGVSVNIAKTGVDVTEITGERIETHTDWSSGAYTSADADIETDSPSGEITLKMASSSYPTSTDSELISDTIDFGTSETDFSVLWLSPSSQPSDTSARVQVAGNTDNTSWTYVGPDGTGSTYFTAASTTLGTILDGKRYVRYKVYLNTDSENKTPSIDEVSFTFNSGCVPDGHALFSGLSTGIYTVTASKTGYTTATSSVSVGSGWQDTIITLP